MSEVVGLGYAEPEVVELGVAVSAVRTQDEVKIGNDGFARFVYTWSSSSSKRVDVESAVTRSLQRARSGQKERSTYPFDRAKLIWGEAGTEWPGGWTWRGLGGWWLKGRRGARGGGDQQQQQQRGSKCPV